MNKNRIPTSNRIERVLVIRRMLQDAAYRSYAGNIRRSEQALQLLTKRPDLATTVARLAPTTAFVHAA